MRGRPRARRRKDHRRAAPIGRSTSMFITNYDDETSTTCPTATSSGPILKARDTGIWTSAAHERLPRSLCIVPHCPPLRIASHLADSRTARTIKAVALAPPASRPPCYLGNLLVERLIEIPYVPLSRLDAAQPFRPDRGDTAQCHRQRSAWTTEILGQMNVGRRRVLRPPHSFSFARSADPFDRNNFSNIQGAHRRWLLPRPSTRSSRSIIPTLPR